MDIGKIVEVGERKPDVPALPLRPLRPGPHVQPAHAAPQTLAPEPAPAAADVSPASATR